MKVIVSCDHVHPNYRLDKFAFDIRKDGALYYAIAAKWGCGKNRSTPEEAVKYILDANACTNIQFHGTVSEMDYYDKIVKDAVEKITDAWGYSATLEAFAKSFADYANSFTEGSEERASTERMAKKVTELSKQLSQMI